MKSLLFLFMLCLLGQYVQGQGITLTNPSACQLELPIADNQCPDGSSYYNPNQFAIQVLDAPGDHLGQDVYLAEVRLLIEHSWTGDLEVRLRSPGGREVLLLDDIGGSANNFGDTSQTACQAPLRLSSSACTAIQAYSGANDQTYLPLEDLYLFSDGTTPFGNWTLSICDDLEEDIGILQFVELVFLPINCQPINHLTVSDVESQTAVLSWDDFGDCNQGQTLIEYGPVGFTPGTNNQAGPEGTLVVATCPPLLLEGLDPETSYDLYIRKQCAIDAFSPNACGTRLMTSCLPPAPTTTENFDQATTCSTRCEESCSLTGLFYNIADDDMDWIAHTGPTPTLETGPVADQSGQGNYAYLEASGTACATGSEAILRSDCFSFQRGGSDSCHLSFYYHLQGVDVGELRVEVSADGGLNWQPLWSATGSQGDNWQRSYLSLGFLPEGATFQIQFVGSKLDGPQGDIALDAISLHGASHLGRPNQVYFADQDGDGYGNANQTLTTCLDTPPEGYVSNNQDCNDSRADIHPGMTEITCDNIDNNCNGIADDRNLPPPIVVNDTICSGEVPLLTAQPVSGKTIFWYSSPTDFDAVVGFGDSFSPNLLPNTGNEPQVYRFYAEETDFICFSELRAEAIVVVLPRPDGYLTESPTVCPGSSIDLADLPILDRNQTNPQLRFFSHPDLLPASLLENTQVQINHPDSFYYEMSTAQGCHFTGEVPLLLHPELNLDFTPAPAFTLCESSSQTIEVLPQGGKAPFQYFWSTGAESAAIQVDAAPVAGSNQRFSVSVTDDNQCTAEAEVNVLTTTSIDSISRSISDVSACNAQDGRLSIQPLSGTPPFQYLWTGTNGSSGDTTLNSSDALILQHLAQGAYRVTITDGSTRGCTFRMAPAYINGPAAELRNVQVQHLSCPTANDGQISLSVRGTPAFAWNDGGSGPIRSGLAPGYYSVTLTEGSCATVIDSIHIQAPAPVNLQVTSTQPTCNQSQDGQISVAAYGGSGSYQYQWSQGSITSSINDLSAGTYELTVSDQQGCQITETIELNAPAPLGLDIEQFQEISCQGADDGRIQLLATGGTGPYRYQWSHGATGSSVQQLRPGEYTLTLTDKNQCMLQQTFVVQEPDSVVVNALTIIPPDCRGDSSGQITVIASGGSGQYTYQWSNGHNGPLNTQLGVGSYTVRATDDNQCTSASQTIVLDAVSDIDFSLQQTNATCLGRSDGSLLVQANGIMPFEYRWSNGDTTPQISQLSAGDYRLTLTDGAGCLIDTTFQIQNSSQPIQATFDIITAQCANTNDALINVNLLQAPHLPLSYQWNDGATSRDRTQLTAGSYQVTITDGIGCRYSSDSLQVNDQPPLSINLVSEGPVRCQGDTNAFLEIAVSGGTAPYQYNWIGSTSTTNTAQNLGAGSYQVFVQDSNGCPANASYQVSEPSLLTADLRLETGNTCLGDYSNLLTVEASGGQQPYRFHWSNGAQDPVLQNLPAGDYGITVEDANQCQEIIPPIKVKAPRPPLSLTSVQSKDISCFGTRDGELSASISGGLAPYTWVVNKAGIIQSAAQELQLEDLPPDDNYWVAVFDAEGCTVRSEVLSIQEPPPLSLRRDSIKDISCFGQASGAIYVTPGGGTAPYAYLWFNSQGQEVAIREDLIAVPADTYVLVVADNNACLDTLSPSTVRHLSTPLKTATLDIQNEECPGEANGAIEVAAAGGRPPYQYHWNTGQETAVITGLTAQRYSVSITDQANCQLVLDDLQVNSLSPPLLLLDSTVVDVTCYGSQDGLLTALAGGGTPPYQTSWEQDSVLLASNTPIISQLMAGTYQFRVVDQLGCPTVFHLSVNEPAPLQIDFLSYAPDNQGNNGRALALVEGGTPPYQYQWSTGDSTAVADQLSAGTYTVSVEDHNGCQKEDRIQLITTHNQASSVIEQVQVFPNPARKHSLLSISSRQPLQLYLRIYSTQGQLIRQTDLGKHRYFQHPISMHEAGKYLLELQDEQGRTRYTNWLLVTQ